jgi:hypothetical protein
MSNIVKKLWNAMAVISALSAFILVFISDATTAFMAVLAGCTFFPSNIGLV